MQVKKLHMKPSSIRLFCSQKPRQTNAAPVCLLLPMVVFRAFLVSNTFHGLLRRNFPHIPLVLTAAFKPQFRKRADFDVDFAVFFRSISCVSDFKTVTFSNAKLKSC